MKLRHIIRSKLLCSEEDRRMLYRIMHAQLISGIRIDSACTMVVERLHNLKPALLAIARSGMDAAGDGLPVMEGWRSSEYIPEDDIGLLLVAERRGTLDSTFAWLGAVDSERESILKSVVSPNLYQFSLFALTLAIVYFAQDIFARFPTMDEALISAPVLSLSSWLQNYSIILAAVLVGTIMLMIHARANWVGKSRLLLLIFNEDWRWQLALRFCHLSRNLYAQGASHSEMIDACDQALGESRYVTRSMNQVRGEVLHDGRRLSDALANRLLSPELAACLDGMVPGEDPRQYPSAMATLVEIYQALLTQKYGRWQRVLNLMLLVGSAAFILFLAHGLFTVATEGFSITQSLR